jgi:uncharacterized membrane protein HdeD (DUF308 family)
MTQTDATATTSASTGVTTFGLRSLSLIRAVFSIIWVGLVFGTAMPLGSGGRLAAITAVLLVIYPLWDAVATFLARRIAGAGPATGISTINIVLGLAATVAMIVAVQITLGATLLVFGIWALLSGALQLTVAIQRRRSVGAKWSMIISGGLSVLAGVSMAATSASGSHGLVLIGGYSAFGAFWFIVSAVALTVRGRRKTR